LEGGNPLPPNADAKDCVPPVDTARSEIAPYLGKGGRRLT